MPLDPPHRPGATSVRCHIGPAEDATMIIGVHALIHAPEGERVRAFLCDVLGFRSVDAGGGWLIFALPPAELGIHPTEGEPHHELYLMCDDLDATMRELEAKGVTFSRLISDEA